MAKRPNAKGRKSSHSFLRLIHPILDHPNYYSLSPRAVKLLIDIAAQYRGTNNGDLCATYSVLKQRGWTSNDQIRKGLNELLERGWLIQSRQGYRPKVASLYAITWEKIDECNGKLDIKSTKVPPNTWRQDPPPKPPQGFPDHRHTVQTEPPHGAMEGANIVTLNRHTAHKAPK